MNENNVLLALLLLIAIIIPPQKNMGAKGFLSNWDRYIEKPVKRLSPPKLIQVRYKLSNAPINIITYLTFLVDFTGWIMCILMLPCLMFLENELFDIAAIIFAIIFLLINLPVGIVRTVCTIKIAKKQKIKLQTEEYVAIRSLAEMLTRKHSSAHREAMQNHKEYVEIIKPFLKDFERCLKKEKGKQYIPEKNLKWLIDMIIPKYQKHLTYTVQSKEQKDKILTIYLAKNNKTIIQVLINK